MGKPHIDEWHMDNFRIIYKILDALEKALDYDKIPKVCFRCMLSEVLSSENRFKQILIMLQKNGYIEGISTREYVGCTEVDARNIGITLKGLEYLADNPILRRIANEEKAEGRLKFDKG